MIMSKNMRGEGIEGRGLSPMHYITINYTRFNYRLRIIITKLSSKPEEI